MVSFQHRSTTEPPYTEILIMHLILDGMLRSFVPLVAQTTLIRTFMLPIHFRFESPHPLCLTQSEYSKGEPQELLSYGRQEEASFEMAAAGWEVEPRSVETQARQQASVSCYYYYCQ